MDKSARWIAVLVLLSAVYYLANQGNYYIHQAQNCELLTKIHYDAGELQLEDYSKAYYAYWPTFYPLIPSWLYRSTGLSPEWIIEGVGGLLILAAMFGMYALCAAYTGAAAAVAATCGVFFVFSDVGGVSPGFQAVVADAVIQTPAALAILLFCFAAFLKARYALSFFLLGVAFCVHPGHAILAAVPLGGVFIWKECRQPNFTTRLFVAAAGGILGALPHLVFVLPKFIGTVTAAGTVPPENIFELSRLIEPHHSFPSSWHPARFLVVGLFLALSWQGRRHLSDATRPVFSALYGVYLVLLLISEILIEGFSIQVVNQISPFRMFSQLTVLCVPPFFLNLRRRILEGGDAFEKLAALGALACVFFSLEGLAVLPAAALLAGSARPRLRAAFCVSAGLAIVLSIFMGELSSYPPARLTGFLLGGFFLPPAFWIAATLIFLVAAFGSFLHRRSGPEGSIVFVIFILIVSLVASVDHRDRRLVRNPRVVDYLDIQVWARENSPPDAEFVVDPSFYGFRNVSRREVFVFWRDANNSRFYPWIYTELIDRLDALSITLEDLKGRSVKNRDEYLTSRFSDLPQSAFAAIRQKNSRTAYAVFSNDRPIASALPVVYRNAHFTVCRTP